MNRIEAHWTGSGEAIVPQGKVCSIVETDLPLESTIFKNKSVTVVWELMFTRAMFETDDMIEQPRLLNRVADKIDAGVLRTTITHRFAPINAINLRKAHALVESGGMIGKVVLERFDA